ncbi:MAG: RNA 3'-terminal phosphate cyclase [Phycisphaerales bacterium]|nr:RNA 3'-terminal phosphate cyclase [Phycisphaerales bacterium]
MILIDGSQGEGGGQILRTALALSMVTGRAFRLTKIRAGRQKPGLMRQHLTCVQAAAQISSAQVIGAVVGSGEITFTPGAIRAGEYHFAIGTAGGTMLVLQAVLPALLRAGGPSVVVVDGGTHNKAAPPFEFFERALVPVLQRAGVHIEAQLDRHGFYPAGGGRLVVKVTPTTEARSVELLRRGAIVEMRARSIVSRLPRGIAVRELEVLCERLGLSEDRAEIVDVPSPKGPGNALVVEVRSEQVGEVFSAIGEVGKPAEQVASELARDVRAYVDAPGAVGTYMADQLMVPLAVLGGGAYTTGPLSEHAKTNMQMVKLFGVNVRADEDGTVRVGALPVS